MGRNLILKGIALLLLAQLASLASAGRASRSASAHGSLSVDDNATANSDSIRSAEPVLQFMKTVASNTLDDDLLKTYGPLNSKALNMKGVSLSLLADNLTNCMNSMMKDGADKTTRTLFFAPVIRSYTKFAEKGGKGLANMTGLVSPSGITNAYGSSPCITKIGEINKALFADKGNKNIKLKGHPVVLQGLKTSLNLAWYLDGRVGAGCEVAEFGVGEVVSKYQDELGRLLSSPGKPSSTSMDIANDLAFLNVYNYMWTADKVDENIQFLFPNGPQGGCPDKK